MSSINKVILLGNITRDLELRFTPSGTAICDLGLAMNRRWRNEAGQQQEATTFIDCRLWGRTADSAAKHLTKGAAVLIEGRLEQEEWLDKETGKKRRKTLVIADTWQFASPRRPDTRAPATESPQTLNTVFTPED